MKEKAYQRLIELTNGRRSSVLIKQFAQSKWSKKIIPSYIKFYDIDTSEVSKNYQQFTSLHDFFVRTLLVEARPIAGGETILTSPVDAKIESFGTIERQTHFFVKNKPYSIVDLLGNNERAKAYENGQFIVFYLSPADYHRIHSPVAGKIIRQYILGSTSYPVNNAGLTYGKKPISHNYRHVTELAVENGKQLCLIKVGATFVNSIVLTNNAAHWKKGEEIGYFSFGSTVVMLFEKDSIAFCDNVVRGAKIRMGEAFANML